MLSAESCSYIFKEYARRLLEDDMNRYSTNKSQISRDQNIDSKNELVRNYPECQLFENMDFICRHVAESNSPSREMVFNMNCSRFKPSINHDQYMRQIHSVFNSNSVQKELETQLNPFVDFLHKYGML